jgi:hypothetical protein
MILKNNNIGNIKDARQGKQTVIDHKPGRGGREGEKNKETDSLNAIS